ncbi:MAG: hypothetical protein EXR48_05480 [Dehalococcoidia bacterium]|nr:hypothetical protein [Dehalococcoidia bacterium]
MILVRRALAALLMVLFALVVVLRLDGALFSHSFYTDQLAKADAYTFLYGEALPVALEDAARDAEVPEVDPAVFTQETTAAVRAVFPPEWLQPRVEELLAEVVPYFTGETDEFAVELKVADRVPLAGEEIKRIVRGSATFDVLYDKAAEKLAEKIVEDLSGLPAGVTLIEEGLTMALRAVVSKEYLAAQTDAAVAELVPYLQGATDHLTVTLALQGRVAVMGEEAKRIAHEGDVAALLLDKVIDPLVDETVRQQSLLAYGITLTREEARSAVREVITPEWLDARSDDLVNVAVDYLTGDTERFSLAVPLADRRDVAFQVLTGLADRKLDALGTALPECTLQQFTSQRLSAGELPSCRPAGVDYAHVKAMLGVGLEPAVRAVFADQIPATWTFDEAQLEGLLGPQAWQGFQDARGWVRRGYTYTDADLHDDLDPDDAATVDRVRGYIRAGYTLTHADFRGELGRTEDGQESLSNLDDGRDALHNVRRFAWLAWLLVPLFLLAVGFLGGCAWWSRLVWASVALVIASLVLLVATWPAYSVGDPRGRVEEAFADNNGPALEPIQRKLAEVVDNIASDLVGGVRVRAGLFLVAGVAGVGAGVALRAVSRRRTPPAPGA